MKIQNRSKRLRKKFKTDEFKRNLIVLEFNKTSLTEKEDDEFYIKHLEPFIRTIGPLTKYEKNRIKHSRFTGGVGSWSEGSAKTSYSGYFEYYPELISEDNYNKLIKLIKNGCTQMSSDIESLDVGYSIIEDEYDNDVDYDDLVFMDLSVLK